MDTYQHKSKLFGMELYEKIFEKEKDLAGKITGMILQFKEDEIRELLSSDQKLKAKIQQANRVLQDYIQKELPKYEIHKQYLQQITTLPLGKKYQILTNLPPLNKQQQQGILQAHKKLGIQQQQGHEKQIARKQRQSQSQKIGIQEQQQDDAQRAQEEQFLKSIQSKQLHDLQIVPDQLGSGSFGSVSKLVGHDKWLKKTFSVSPDKDYHAYQFNFETYESINQILKDLDPHGRYFGGILLRTQSIDVGKHREIKKKIKYGIMKNQGQSLYTYNKSRTRNIQGLIQSFPQLIEAVCLLSSNGYLHADAKLENIIIRGLKLKLIDCYEYMNTTRYTLSDALRMKRETLYYIWPPELWWGTRSRYSTQFLFNLLKKAGVLRTETTYKDFLNVLGRSIPTEDIQDPWLKKLSRASRLGETKELFDKFDIYTLGIVGVELFYKDVPQLRPLLDKMIDPVNADRISPQEALIEWKKLIQSLR